MPCEALQLIFYCRVVLPCIRNTERLVAIYDEVVHEIFDGPAAEAGGITNDLLLLRDDLHIRSAVECIYHHERALGSGKSKAELCRSFGWGDLCSYVCICVVHAV